MNLLAFNHGLMAPHFGAWWSLKAKISDFHYFTGTLLIVVTQLNFHVAKLYGRSSSPFFARNRTTKHTESFNLLKYFYC